MNTDKLYKLLDGMIKAEEKTNTQGHLQGYKNAFTQLMSNPQNINVVQNTEIHSDTFFTSMEEFKAEFTQNDYLRVCSVSEHFAPNKYNVAKYTYGADMSALYSRVSELFEKREDVFNRIRNIKENFDYFEIGNKTHEEDEEEEKLYEIGFIIPRNLFDNSFDGMIEETQDIQRMVRFFSEATLGEYEPAKVRNISTSDPIFYLVMNLAVIMCFARSVTWALNTWKAVEEIRNLRADTKNRNMSIRHQKRIEELLITLEKEEKANILTAAEKKAEKILKSGNPPKDRHGELKAHLIWALQSLIAKIERGFKIEYQIPPPTDNHEEEDDAEKAKIEKIREEIVNIEKTQIFPEPSDNPTLQIPEFKEENGKEKSSKK